MLNNELWQKSAAGATADFYDHQIEQSVRFDKASGTRLRRTPSSAGNRTTWAISMWIKRASTLGSEVFLYEAGASGGSDTRLRLVINGDDKIMITNSNANLVISTGVLRDVSGWYHIHWRNVSNTNTCHVNGVQFTSVSISGNTAVHNSGNVHGIGCRGGTGDDTTTSFDGHIAEVLIFDGNAYEYTDVTEVKDDVLIPKDPSSLTFGTNGAHLKFQDSSALGDDTGGGGNDYAASNLGADHQSLDSPTIGTG
jgi:hypothetical protein